MPICGKSDAVYVHLSFIINPEIKKQCIYSEIPRRFHNEHYERTKHPETKQKVDLLYSGAFALCVQLSGGLGHGEKQC